MPAITTDTLVDNRFDKSTTGAGHVEIWTESDTDYFQTPAGNQIMSKGISVDTSGTYELTMADDLNTIVYLTAGIIHPIHAKRVRTGGAGGGVVYIWW